MTDLAELYQDVILDHGRRPRRFGRLAAASHSAEGDNPLCGDQVHLELAVAEDRIDDVAFEGRGCAISTASASLMAEAVAGKSVEEARRLSELFRRLMRGEGGAATEDLEELGKLAALHGVREYPMRVKCATLPWHTFEAALAGGATVSTE